MNPDLTKLSSTVLLVLLSLWLGRVERAREQAGARDPKRNPPKVVKRAPGDLSAGEAVLRVQVTGADGEWINLGTSRESYESVSAAPTLQCAGFSVRTESGSTLALREAVPLEISKVYGARRKVIESLTGPEGIAHVFSFEVSAGTWIWIHGRIADDGSAGTPFRETPTRQLDPSGDKYRLSGEEPAAATNAAGAGCWTLLAIAVAIFGVGALYFGWIGAWWAFMGVFAVLTLLGLVAMPAKPARATESAPDGEKRAP